MKITVKHIILIVFLVFVAASIYTNVYLFLINKELKSNNFNYEKQHKIQDSLIDQSNSRIKDLELLIQVKNEAMMISKSKIDSIIALRDSNKVVYRTIIKEIESYDNQSIEKYWKNEFNK